MLILASASFTVRLTVKRCANRRMPSLGCRTKWKRSRSASSSHSFLGTMSATKNGNSTLAASALTSHPRTRLLTLRPWMTWIHYGPAAI